MSKHRTKYSKRRKHPKINGYPLLNQAYKFFEDIARDIDASDDELTKVILRQDLEAFKAAWEPALLHCCQKACGLDYLHLAVITGNLPIVKLTVESGLNVDTTAYTRSSHIRSFSDLSKLHLAVLLGHHNVTEYLLKCGCYTENHIRLRSKLRKKYALIDGMTPFHFAVIRRDFGAMKILQKYKASASASTTRRGYTAIHLAAMLNYDDILEHLMKNNTILQDLETKLCLSPLWLAARNGASKTLRCLIANGFGVNAASPAGETALHAAVKYGKTDIVEQLCASGADVNCRAKNVKMTMTYLTNNSAVLSNITPLHVAVVKKRISCLETLLKHGADPNQMCSVPNMVNDSPPLHLAILLHSASICRMLLNHGADVNVYNPEGCTALLGSIIEGDVDVIKCLLENEDIDLNKGHMNSGFGPLALAVVARPELVPTILEYAEFELDKEVTFSGHEILLNVTGVKVIQLAVETGRKDLVELLIKKGASVSTTMNTPRDREVSLMHTAAENGYYDMVKILHAAGAPLDLRTQNGITPLQAAMDTSIPIAMFLLDQGADPDGGYAKRTPLMSAAVQDDVKLMNQLISRGCDINRQDSEEGQTALHFAIINSATTAAHVLLDAGCNINLPTKALTTTLSLAVEHGGDRLVQRLLSMGADPNEACFYKTIPFGTSYISSQPDFTPLHLAACFGRVKILRQLIKHGANINAKMGVEFVPLQLALHHMQSAAAALLVRSGAHVNVSVKLHLHMTSPFHTATLYDQYNMMDLLFDMGANIFEHIIPLKKHAGIFAQGVHYSITARIHKLMELGLDVWNENLPLLQLVERNHEQPVRLLLQHGASIVDDNEEILKTICMRTVMTVDMLDLFLQYGVDLKGLLDTTNPAEDPGTTGMLKAARAGRLDFLQKLVNFGLDVNCRDENGLTPLHVASWFGQKHCVQFLIQNGASLTALASAGGYHEATPLHIAVLANKKDVLVELLRAGADVESACLRGKEDGITPLMVAAYRGAFNAFIMLMTNSCCDVNKQTSSGKTVLHIVIKHCIVRKLYVRLLLAAGCDVNIPTTSGMTSLMYAVLKKQVTITRQLLACGSDVNAAAGIFTNEEQGLTVNHTTALHLAAESNQVKILKMLLEVGADLNAGQTRYDVGSYTPLHTAVLGNSLDVIPLLIAARCNRDAQTTDGLTPLHIAAKEGFMDVAKYLIDSDVNPKLRTKCGQLASNLALFPALARLLLGYEAAWDIKRRRSTLQRKRYSLQQRLSMQRIESFTTNNFNVLDAE